MDELISVARAVRREVVVTVAHAQAGHLGGPLSAADILTALYFRVLNIRPDEPDWPERDRFVLSKGHSSVALYATLALRGFFPVAELSTFGALDSRLQGHPDMTALPGLDMSTGSLGLGLSAGVGIALGGKLARQSFTTFVMVGDGECNEGIVWEAADVAARHGLDNLVVIVDKNDLQQYCWHNPGSVDRKAPYGDEQLSARWTAFGWSVSEVDGHNMARVIDALEAAKASAGGPAVVIAHTVKGKGVSYMEGNYRWHSRVLTEEELATALAELAMPQVHSLEA
ncbi:MAG: transketolase [Chloroflexi bacterium]|nr:transketolase [Chloroflexota bacterium]